jgi:transcriptional regulator with XRE-family HTH domain
LETPILQLRKALGLTQPEMATLLGGIGKSTEAAYESGSKLSPAVRAIAIEIALQHKLASLAQLFSQYPADANVEFSRYNPQNFTWHDVLEKVLETGDKRAKNAVQSALALAGAWIEKESEK